VRHPFRRKNLSPRLLPYYLIAALVLLLAEPTPLYFGLGTVVVCAGAALRAWGAGHLVKNDRLIVAGPYAHLRHPLYAGTLLLGIGFGIIAGGWGLALILAGFLPIFFLYYLPYKERIESARLERRYGGAYSRYRAAVRALLPALAPWTPSDDGSEGVAEHWRAERFRDNGEIGTLIGVGIALALFALRALSVA
jgi:protein-S-isoprenylcysteine O-methyltransferase Ste14